MSARSSSFEYRAKNCDYKWKLCVSDVWLPRVWLLHQAEEYQAALIVPDGDSACLRHAVNTDLPWSNLVVVELGDCVRLRTTAYADAGVTASNPATSARRAATSSLLGPSLGPAAMAQPAAALLVQVDKGWLVSIRTTPDSVVPLVSVYVPQWDNAITLKITDVRALEEQDIEHTGVDPQEARAKLVKWLQHMNDPWRAVVIEHWMDMTDQERLDTMFSAARAALKEGHKQLWEQQRRENGPWLLRQDPVAAAAAGVEPLEKRPKPVPDEERVLTPAAAAIMAARKAQKKKAHKKNEKRPEEEEEEPSEQAAAAAEKEKEPEEELLPGLDKPESELTEKEKEAIVHEYVQEQTMFLNEIHELCQTLKELQDSDPGSP